MEEEFCVFNFPQDQTEASHAYFHKVIISKQVLFCID